MNNPFQLIQMFQQVRNPKQLFMSLMQKRPEYQQALSQVQNSSNGASYKDICMQLAQKQGIPQEQLMQMYNQLSNK